MDCYIKLLCISLGEREDLTFNREAHGDVFSFYLHYSLPEGGSTFLKLPYIPMDSHTVLSIQEMCNKCLWGGRMIQNSHRKEAIMLMYFAGTQ